MTIRNLDERVKSELRLRAARAGHSMEEEARRVLAAAVELKPARERGLADRIRTRFAETGGVDLVVRDREVLRDDDLPDFDGP